MKNLYFIGLLCLISFLGCKEPEPIDQCEFLDCGLNGTCQNSECVCDESYAGTTCTELDTPSYLWIETIDLYNIGGYTWDANETGTAQNPDVFIVITQDGEVVYQSDILGNFASVGSIPVFVEIYAEDLNTIIEIEAWDFDTNGHDYITSVVCYPFKAPYHSETNRYSLYLDADRNDFGIRGNCTYIYQ